MRTAAAACACLGLALLATTGTVGWLRANSAATGRNSAVAATTARASDISASVTTLLRQDADLLLTLAREPSFAEWEALPGDRRRSCPTRTGGGRLREEIARRSSTTPSLFPSAFQTLEFVDTTTSRPIAISNDGAWSLARDAAVELGRWRRSGSPSSSRSSRAASSSRPRTPTTRGRGS